MTYPVTTPGLPPGNRRLNHWANQVEYCKVHKTWTRRALQQQAERGDMLVCLLLACLTSQQHASVSQGRICLTSQQHTGASQGRICLTSQQHASVSQGRICLTSQQHAGVSQGRICLTSQQHTGASQGRICLTSQQHAGISQGRICLTSQQRASVSQARICLTSQQHAGVSQGRICTDNFTRCHTEIAVADPTFYLTQPQYTDTRPTSPSADRITPGAWQGSHWSANV